MKTGDQISPPGGYVGGGLQMQTDIDVDPAGNVWAMNNWQDIDAASARPRKRSRLDAAGKALWFSTAWPNRFGRRRSAPRKRRRKDAAVGRLARTVEAGN